MKRFKNIIKKAEDQALQRDKETLISLVLKKVTDPKYSHLDQVQIVKAILSRFKSVKTDLGKGHYNEYKTIKDALKELK